MMIERFYLKSYQPGDELAISALFTTVFGHTLTPAQWAWKYRGLNAALPWSQLAVDATGAVLAHAGAVMLPGQYRGLPLPFYQLADVMVHPAARGYLGTRSLFTHLIKNLISTLATTHSHAFGYGFPGERPFLLGERLGLYERIATAQEHIWLVGLPGRRWWRPVELDWTQPVIERIWHQRVKDHALSIVRDRRYLIWRYAHNPFRHYHLLGFSLLGRIYGWAVLTMHATQCRVLELLIPPQGIFAALRVIDDWARIQGATHGVIWLPAHQSLPAPFILQNTSIVVTNVRGGLPFETTIARQSLVYSMGDVDIF